MCLLQLAAAGVNDGDLISVAAMGGGTPVPAAPSGGMFQLPPAAAPTLSPDTYSALTWNDIPVREYHVMRCIPCADDVESFATGAHQC